MYKRSVSLQDMCLVSVVKNIDFFVYNKIPQKHVDFLFRAYSDEFFSNYRSLKVFTDDFIMWYLSSSLKKVNLPAMFYSQKIFRQLKVIASEITSLDLYASRVDEIELNSVISCLTNVVHLDLSRTSCSNATLSWIRKSCPNLESLNISCCEKVNCSGMEILCNSKLSLKSLNISYSGVKLYGGAIILNKMTSLECLKYENIICLLYHETVSNKHYNLTEFPFDSSVENAVEKITAYARMFPKLKKLYFISPVDEEVLEACVQFQNLEELKIKSTHKYASLSIDDVLIPVLPISKNLKTLILSCVKISVLTLIENFTNLKSLYLKKVSFTPFEKKDVKITKTNLNTLILKDIDVEDHDANYEAVSLLISLSKNVTILQINSFKHLPSEMFRCILESMKCLKVVHFNDNSQKAPAVDQFFEIPSLDTIMANHFDDELYFFNDSNSLAKNTSCTLSWRVMYKPMDIFWNLHTNYYGNENDIVDSDVLSNMCYSESDESLASSESDEFDYEVGDRYNSS